MRVIKRHHGGSLCFIVLSLFSTTAFAQNPFLDESSSAANYDNSEIRRLQSDIEMLKRDMESMFMSNGGEAGMPPGPGGSDDSLLNEGEQDMMGAGASFDGYFEVNGVHILKKQSSNDIGYLEVSQKVFNKVVDNEKMGSGSGNGGPRDVE